MRRVRAIVVGDAGECAGRPFRARSGGRPGRAGALFVLVLASLVVGLGEVRAGPGPGAGSAWESVAGGAPEAHEVWRIATLRDYNTRLVVLSTFFLGLSSGLAGTFLLLRKRSLMGDALSHACLPGIGVAFLVLVGLGHEGKSLVGLLAGAMVAGLLGVGTVLLIRNSTRIKDDTAMGIVLSVFFGAGVAVLGMVQSMPGASAAGLEAFIYGKTASMILRDFWILTGVTVAVLAASLALKKEFLLLCFDEGFARSQGWPVHSLDVAMLVLVAVVTVVGLQAVGLILIIAFLIAPAAAARFWSSGVRPMLYLAGAIGGISGWLGASMSALLPRLPAGAIIVLVEAAVFVVSMLLGSERGALPRWISRRRLNRKVRRQHLLRAVYEVLEGKDSSRPPSNVPVRLEELSGKRTWNEARLRALIRSAGKDGYVESFDGEALLLGESGYGEAARITRNHRLWEVFLINHADIAASHVDRDADSVEHVLSPAMVRELERKLGTRSLPDSPHPLESAGGKS